MVGSVLYVVNVKSTIDRKQRRGILAVHVLAYVLGASLLGLMVGALGVGLRMSSLEFTTAGALLLLAFLAVLLSLREMNIFSIPLPVIYRQVPARWRVTLPTVIVSALYGLELGFGITTHVFASTFYIPLVGALLLGDPLLGALTIAGFGMGRAASLLLVNHFGADVNQLSRDVGGLETWKPAVHVMNGLLLCIVSGIFLGLGLRALG